MLRQMFAKLMEMGQRELVNYIPMIASKQKVNHKQCCASKSHPKLLQGFTAFKQKDSLQYSTTTVNVSCEIFEFLRKKEQKASIFIFSFAKFRREMLMNRGRVCYIGILFLFILYSLSTMHRYHFFIRIFTFRQHLPMLLETIIVFKVY